MVRGNVRELDSYSSCCEQTAMFARICHPSPCCLLC